MSTEQTTDQQTTTEPDVQGADAERTPVDNSHETEIQTDNNIADAEETTDNDSKNPNHEAAKYRRQLRDTEAQRDALQARLDQRNREQVERIAAQHLAVPADLFDIGQAELANLLNDDGDPDPDKINDSIKSLLESRPGLAVEQSTAPVTAAYEKYLEGNGKSKTISTGPMQSASKIKEFQDQLDIAGPYLNMDALKDETGNFSPEKVGHLQTLLARRVWPDMGGGIRSGLGRSGSNSPWQDLIKGD